MGNKKNTLSLGTVALRENDMITATAPYTYAGTLINKDGKTLYIRLVQHEDTDLYTVQTKPFKGTHPIETQWDDMIQT